MKQQRDFMDCLSEIEDEVGELPPGVRDDILLDAINVYCKTPSEENRQHAIALARDALAGVRDRRRPPLEQMEMIPVDPPMLTSYDQARERGYAAYLAREAAKDKEVKAWRQDVLNGRLLAPQEVTHLLSCSVLRYLSVAEWRASGSPSIGYAVTVNEHPELYDRELRTAQIALTIQLEPGGDAIRVERTLKRADDVSWYQFAYPNSPEGQIYECFAGSAVHQLWGIAQRLSKQYSWLDVASAVRFILTREMPRMSAMVVAAQVRGRFLELPTISMHLSPWLSTESVTAGFIAAREVLGYTPPARRRGEIKFDIYCFVEEQTAANGGERPPMRELARRWNDLQRSAIDPRHFQRHYKNAESALLRQRNAK